MKTQHLDYARLADHLVERSLVDGETMRSVMQQCGSSGDLLTEVLVKDNLISDWEVSRICAELFNLPFLPVEIYPPSEEARQGLDPHYLRQYGLVPLDRFGSLLTVAMPGLVPSEVLNGLRGMGELVVLPVVGSVQGNRNWLDQNLVQQVATRVPVADQGPGLSMPDEESWASLFDEAEQAVQLDLQGTDDSLDEPDEAPDAA